MDNSWIQFGPAGRGSYDWDTGASAPPPSPGNRLQGFWNEPSSIKPDERTQATPYVLTVVGSLLVLGGIIFFIYRRCFRAEETSGKVITLNLEDAEGTAEVLSSLEDSEEANDGVFLMVYLSPPYEQTLSRIARAASSSSSHNDDHIVEISAEETKE
ncbi:hypothetical protein DNTS_008794 [Danionella cerebrum]|uniref:Uncharacterized protein n=1 Tax=Danionella cerebrum TaxID=2873325 RepID=A0A553Q6T3_9TELE|nr:hypothetical protein DNTS_008794 [Danionella translucida]